MPRVWEGDSGLLGSRFPPEVTHSGMPPCWDHEEVPQEHEVHQGWQLGVALLQLDLL